MADIQTDTLAPAPTNGAGTQSSTLSTVPATTRKRQRRHKPDAPTGPSDLEPQSTQAPASDGSAASKARKGGGRRTKRTPAAPESADFEWVGRLAYEATREGLAIEERVEELRAMVSAYERVCGK